MSLLFESLRDRKKHLSHLSHLFPNINVKIFHQCFDRARPSAARATSNADQRVPANTFVKVRFQNEDFDLNNEYNPANSTFSPRQDGVYQIIGTISFDPDNNNVDYRARVEIRVNGNPAISTDNDFFGGGVNFSNVVSVATILQLQAGDRVEVFAQSSTPGFIRENEPGGNSTRFEIARFPSPL
ncbi:C1q-like domain-containing protein [Robertmurraya andreesenii]|uniref:C1q domain-containing protein n=1 Tax=Anoxybacillus andreesenii TaxID=1325932 RepID=A0ABT9V1F0_9BACL|nr:ABC transporter permease [Robertmurraya andreesenii]MDQ0154782.1 hypothetical protein [Robertmurraya andreesenii]